MEVLIATNNKHKVEEYQKILFPFDFECKSLDDLKIKSNPVENGKTFKENSLIKAFDVKQKTNAVIVADDSGLIIESLPDILGVHSSRFMEGHNYEEKCAEIIKRLKGKSRKAKFVCCITLIIPGQEPIQFEGICEGKIGYKYEGNNGFGYDPIFIPNGYNETMASLPEGVKNNISHRANATKKMIEYLKRSNRYEYFTCK